MKQDEPRAERLGELRRAIDDPQLFGQRICDGNEDRAHLRLRFGLTSSGRGVE